MKIEEILKYKARRYLYQLEQKAYLNKQKALKDMDIVNKNEQKNNYEKELKEKPQTPNNNFDSYNKAPSYNDYGYHDVYPSKYDTEYQNYDQSYYEQPLNKKSNIAGKLTSKLDEIEEYLEEIMSSTKKLKK